MIDMKDSRIRLCTTYVEDGKKKAVVQVQLTPKKRRVYILTVFQDKFGHDVFRLRRSEEHTSEHINQKKKEKTY